MFKMLHADMGSLTYYYLINILAIFSRSNDSKCRGTKDSRKRVREQGFFYCILRPEGGGGGVNGTFLVFEYLIIATGDEQKEKNRIKI